MQSYSYINSFEKTPSKGVPNGGTELVIPLLTSPTFGQNTFIKMVKRERYNLGEIMRMVILDGKIQTIKTCDEKLIGKLKMLHTKSGSGGGKLAILPGCV